jgi:hypothetical protein
MRLGAGARHIRTKASVCDPSFSLGDIPIGHHNHAHHAFTGTATGVNG